MKAAILVICLTILSAPTAAKAEVTGNMFAPLCNPEMQNTCAFYAIGVIQGVELVSKNPLFCLPNGVTPKQGAEVFAKFLKDHPEKLHKSAAFLVIESEIEAFPCKD